MHLPLDMPRQPSDTTCGPTCLHAIYRFHGIDSDLAQLVGEVPQFEDGGGTFSVHLARHALGRGLDARLISYNLRIFDPTWWNLSPAELIEKLQRRVERLSSPKLCEQHRAYIDFLQSGGQLEFFDLSPQSLAHLLTSGAPVLTGLSATYLYQSPRELPDGTDDDVGGSPVGHFVVATGWRAETQEVVVADPFERNPYNPHGEYRIDVHRFINAVMLSIVTYDANLLLITPRHKSAAASR